MTDAAQDAAQDSHEPSREPCAEPRSEPLWHRLVGIDPRSLATLRIGLALILIYDLLDRSRDLEAHYSDTGLLPRADLLAWKADAVNFSVHLLSGLWWMQGLLLAIGVLAAIFLLVGRYTRTATFVSWLLLASLHARNPLVLHGGDQLLRCLLFWCLFLPMGRSVSLDALARGDRVRGQVGERRKIVSVATLALKLQVCGMYWTTAVLKWHPIWIEDGTAVLMALKLDQLATPFGRFLTQWPAMLEVATFGTMWLEILGPLLVFSPWFTERLQLLAVVIFAGFHVFGLAPALYLGIFPFVCAAAWMQFLPARFWDEWRHRLPGQSRVEALGRKIVHRVAPPTSLDLAETHPLQVRSPRLTSRLVPWLSNVAVAFLLVYVALWNLRTIDFERYEKILPRSANFVGNFLQLGQLWNLFAPFPATEDGWFVFEGTTVGGRTVDARTGGEPSHDKPANVSRSLGNQRWKKYLMNLDERQNGLHRRFFGRYLCETWNRRHTGDDRLASIHMFVYREQTLPDGSEREPLQGTLWNQVCVLDDG